MTTSIELLQGKALYLVTDWTLIGTRRSQEIKGAWAAEAHAKVDSAKIAKVTVRNPTLKAIWALKGRVMALQNHYGMPSSQDKRKVVPLANIATVEEKLTEAAKELETLAWALQQEWPKVLADAQERLGDLFNPKDYPTANEVASMFSLRWRWLPIADTPLLLQAVAADVHEADLKRAREEVEADLLTMRVALRGSLVEIIRRMRATLTKPDGETRRFGKKFFNRLNAFTEMFEVKNLSDDVTMQALVSDLTRAAQGIDVTTFKDDQSAQVALDAELARIEDVLGELSEEYTRELVLA